MLARDGVILKKRNNGQRAGGRGITPFLDGSGTHRERTIRGRKSTTFQWESGILSQQFVFQLSSSGLAWGLAPYPAEPSAVFEVLSNRRSKRNLHLLSLTQTIAGAQPSKDTEDAEGILRKPEKIEAENRHFTDRIMTYSHVFEKITPASPHLRKCLKMQHIFVGDGAF